jgi:hypothetical protein
MLMRQASTAAGLGKSTKSGLGAKAALGASGALPSAFAATLGAGGAAAPADAVAQQLAALQPEADSDPFAYAADLPARAAEAEARAQAAREAQLLPLQKGDLPEGFEGLMTEPAGLWQLLQDLRRDKVASEHALHARSRALEAMKAHLALLAARYVTHKTAIDAIQTARDAIVNARELGQNDVELLLRLKMGQDEVSANNADCTPHPLGGATEVEWSHAIFAPADVVEAVNGDVRKLGLVKVGVLEEIKAFRKGLLYQKWEARYRQARADDEHEFHRDLQLMRAVGPVREFIMGVNIALKARQEVDRAEAKMAHLRKSHERALVLTDKSEAKVAAAIETREKAMASLARQTAQLKEGVALREVILRARSGGGKKDDAAADGEDRGGGTGSGNSALEEKMRTVALHGKLAAVAKQQAAEIKSLRQELARMLERSFPTLR